MRHSNRTPAASRRAPRLPNTNPDAVGLQLIFQESILSGLAESREMIMAYFEPIHGLHRAFGANFLGLYASSLFYSFSGLQLHPICYIVASHSFCSCHPELSTLATRAVRTIPSSLPLADVALRCFHGSCSVAVLDMFHSLPTQIMMAQKTSSRGYRICPLTMQCKAAALTLHACSPVRRQTGTF